MGRSIARSKDAFWFSKEEKRGNQNSLGITRVRSLFIEWSLHLVIRNCDHRWILFVLKFDSFPILIKKNVAFNGVVCFFLAFDFGRQVFDFVELNLGSSNNRHGNYLSN
jgi:hypothetical protein